MDLVTIILTCFIVLELANVFTLYFNHSTTFANGVGVFDTLKETTGEQKDLMNYLIYWVAGVKLMMLFLLLDILVYGSKETKVVATGVLALTSLTFYFKLYPLIKKMDTNNKITPPGYSSMLSGMIVLIFLMFSSIFVYNKVK